MPSTDFPWEPSLAGSETEHLFGALDRLRTTLRWKADGLDDQELRATVGASALTIWARPHGTGREPAGLPDP